MKLECECGNETEFYSITTVSFIVDYNGEREEILGRNTHYYCLECDAEVYGD